MPDNRAEPVRKKDSRIAEIAEALRLKIVGPGFALGEQLPPISRLAREFDVSVRTVHLALGRLEADGYVVKKNGVGTFVASRYTPMTLRETAAVCMESGVHLYGELWSRLMEALQSRQMVPVGMDTAHGDARELISRLYYADIRYFLVHLTGAAQWDLFTQPGFQKKPVIAFFGAPPSLDWPDLYRILSDFKGMGQLAAEHLWSKGCRRLLIVGTHSDKYYLRRLDAASHAVAPSLVEAWEARGGAWAFVDSSEDEVATSRIRFDEDSLVAAVKKAEGPDAILGTRDVDVWEAQQVIRRRLPEYLNRLRLCGMFDTPWSRAGSPPFSTVSVDVPAMVVAATGILDALRAGKKPASREITVTPKLIVREEIESP